MRATIPNRMWSIILVYQLFIFTTLFLYIFTLLPVLYSVVYSCLNLKKLIESDVLLRVYYLAPNIIRMCFVKLAEKTIQPTQIEKTQLETRYDYIYSTLLLALYRRRFEHAI